MKYRFSLPESNESHQQTALSIFRAAKVKAQNFLQRRDHKLGDVK